MKNLVFSVEDYDLINSFSEKKELLPLYNDIEFSTDNTTEICQSLIDYPNLVVLQTLSKAWGLAGLRLGMAFASEAIVGYLNKVKAPYNINLPAQELTLKALEEVGQVNDMIQELVQLRIALAGVFEEMPMVEVVYPSDTNFLLIKIPNATKLYQFLLTKGIVVRDRSNLPNCADTLRITVGTEQENTALVDAMIEWMEQQLT
jgi:histidinol-phosphate aminotransferase